MNDYNMSECDASEFTVGQILACVNRKLNSKDIRIAPSIDSFRVIGRCIRYVKKVGRGRGDVVNFMEWAINGLENGQNLPNLGFLIPMLRTYYGRPIPNEPKPKEGGKRKRRLRTRLRDRLLKLRDQKEIDKHPTVL